MKTTKLLILTSLISLNTVFAHENMENDSSFPRLENPFFGQKPPGLIPEIFSPRIVSTEHSGLVAGFLPDLKEFYFRKYDEGLENDALVAIQYKDNLWTETFVVPRGEISPDGKILYKGNEYREQTPSGWSAIKSLGAPFDSIPIMRLTASSKGTYYFDDVSLFNAKPPIVHIRYSRLIDGIHEKPRTLDLDTGTTLKFHPFIAPDESYLIFDSKTENGNADIYISFRQKDGSWGTAINLGDTINTELSEVYGSVTPDGKYFFFRRTLSNGKKNTMWVDTGFIEALRPKSDEFPVLQGPYLGQKSPGLIPEVFAPGFVSINGRYEGTISFSPDLDEIYFGAKNKNKETAIYFSKIESNKWTPIEKVAFTKGKKEEEIHPFVSPNGKRIYFTAFSSDMSDTTIWYVNRLEHSWSEAIKLDLPINDDLVFFPNQTKKGDLYYFNLSKRKTYYAAYSKGGFPEVKEVEIEPGFHHVFISPNQDYLVVNARNKNDGRNDNDLYVAFKEQDGTWAKPINLGDAVNTNVNEKSPSITPDGKYLFFGRDEEDGKANIYWVNTEIITSLKATYFKQQ
jgi:Tol biopolymer transport system component